MTTLLRRNYPRRSRAIEAIFFLLFVIVMLPVWPLAAICLLAELSGKIIDWYSVVWTPLNRLHNRLNPYRED
ncbi:DUF4014 family protein [Salmonella enterica]|nr:DUF4014 family protein [Salmonella enterica]EJF6007891.1 DUF4014 family protein [Salmonella enterica]EJF6165250.1 DUF4014 family protein [Salmonella enterica]